MAVARVEVVKVVVDSSVMFRGRGSVKNWMRGVQRDMTSATKSAAPRRTGALKAGVRGTVATTGVRRCEGRTWSRVPYTPYVVYGTSGPIMSNVGWAHGIGFGKSWILVPGRFGPMPRGVPFHWMKLPPGNGFPTVYADAVRGQSANNFFYKGYVVTRIKHRSLPEKRPARRVGRVNGRVGFL